MIYYVQISKDGYLMIDIYKAYSIKDAAGLAMKCREVSRSQVKVLKYRDMYGNVIPVEDEYHK